MLLSGRVAVVTGGGRGIGAAICRVLAREGAGVAVNYAHSAEKADAVVAGIVEAGGMARSYRCDVRDAADVQRMISAAHNDFGRLDCVVNNAIAGKQHGPFSDAALQDFNDAYDYGCRAVIHSVSAARPLFKQQGGGRIINIVTELWNMAPGEWTVYMAGKGAMVGLSRSFAHELGPDNITVNMVAPGWMADEKVDLTSDASKKFARSIPLRRHGSADEIGNACAFLMSDLASYITGAYLPVTGGRITQMG